MNEMMSCAQARDLMLEADLGELRGVGESQVARHVRGCSECARHASRILNGYDLLDKGLTSIERTDHDVVPIRKQAALRWLPAPLAAAAVIALMFVTRQSEPPPNVDGVARLMFNESAIVAPRPGQQAMVIEKREMTIVWLYQQETR